ncbi:Transcriptional regulator HilA [compost metagenome]
MLDSSVSRFNGKVLQYYGDGSLSIFSSANDSVDCAIAIQQQLQEDPKVDLRIGIHTGDVTIEDEAIYGDGVNMASRIESLAVPGAIFISEKVYDEIKNQDAISTVEMGFFELKNVKQPIHVFAIANNGIAVPSRNEIKGKTKQPGNRLAVLPFVNMSSDVDNEYFSDGITEELLNALTKVDGLQVTSRTSSFAFKGKNHDIRDIAMQLNVDKVLEGSVRKAGNKVRITTQLINAVDGYHIWSETYDRDLNDIFEVQDEISGIIANKLRENLNSNPKEESLVHPTTNNYTAYIHYLKGLHFWNKLTPADTYKAIEYFEKAISIEPDYAQAYAKTAMAYGYLGAKGQILPKQAFEIVHQYADKAMRIDPTVAESYSAKAGAYIFYDWKWKEAYEALQMALKLNPATMSTYEMLGFYHIVMGQKEEAVKILEKAAQIDPLSPLIIQSLGNAYIIAERYEEAIREAEKLLEMNPEMRSAMEMKAWGIGMGGDWQSSLKWFEEVHRLTNHPLKGLMGLGFAYAKLGEREKALDCIKRMEQRSKEEPNSVIDADMAAVWFALGEKDKTFEHLFICIEKHMGPVCYYLEYPPYKGIKDDPRYMEIRKKEFSIG